ncbi:SusC/RagA family TonB-linked outer membrane protein [Spongiivirga citrea]|uniref:SusC/RagA family TonB-linked outer membrane protein n=1 Tax=Spongiivirga citrea TaxID=1481457 RepID=A0A6M0CGQ2_9FLAO|nr:TonB-dependent receptor [Spongiivirga citrea]NER16113.1 SusC/RagA family TonB-linked outer membrane protein [Spongiivirga citrea]
MKKTNILQLQKTSPPDKGSLKKVLLGVFLMLFFTVTGFAQQTISGTVYDSDGAPLPGASVVVKGTTTGTQTDFDGNYSISAASDATLVFSYVGFATQEVAVNGQTTIDVTLAEAENQLSEVVVTGYSTQTRGDITGSISSVDVSEATKAPIVNAAEALQGRVTGVTVVNNGNPGAAPKINIRGFGTSNNTNPLYIIDGVQTDNPSVLNSINPNDIAQFNVLKDGAAAIYGARASNGVVIITTKSGGYNMSKPVISVDLYTGFSQATNIPELLNAQQHGDMLFQSAANDGVAAFSHPQYGSGANAVVPTTLNGYTRVVSYNPIVRGPASASVTPGGTDWLDAILDTAPTQSGSISIQNGNETGKYLMSASFLNRDGIQRTTGFKQGITRLNSEFKLNEYITIGEHLSASFSNTVNGNQVNGALRSSPLIPVFDDEGRFAGTGGAGGLGNARSPVAQLERGADNFNKLFRVFGDVYLSAKIFDGFTAKTTISGNIESFDSRSFQALDPEHGEPLGTNTLTEQSINNYNWTWTNTVNYNKTFGDHSINALAGIEAVKEGSKGNSISVDGFLFETPDFYLLENGTGTPNVGFAFDGSNSLFSIFGTANYSYQGKYFATVTVRNDKSSRFLGDNQSQTFPSFSAGWLLSDEDFFPSDGFLNRAKIKASWGELGNQTLPANNPTVNISALSLNLANYAINGSTIATGAILRDVGNPNLKWETSVTTNVGFELGMLDNKLSLEFEYFNIETDDLITRDFSLISSTAIDASAPFVNLGTVKNTGFDLALGFNDQSDSGFAYGISANISAYKNEVTELISDFQTGASFRPGTLTRTEVGRPISSFYGLNITGFDANGRFTYEDLNGDNTINAEDRQFIGSPHPDFTFGLNLNASYKGFDISAFFNGSQGNDIYNYEKIFTDFPTFVNGNRSVRVLDSWTPTNTNAILPALSLGGTGETAPSTYFVEDGSFIRLRNLQIGYTLPSNVTDKIGMDNLRVYVQGSNLFTITDYEGFDPEIITNDNLTLGVDSNIFPQARIITLGVNLKL